jgi:hypothetical protein
MQQLNMLVKGQVKNPQFRAYQQAPASYSGYRTVRHIIIGFPSKLLFISSLI